MCDNAVDGTCSRCSPTPPQLCCDLCNPSEFEDEYIVSLEKRKSQPRRSTMKPYEPSENDKTLRERLDSWRWEMSDTIFGELFTAGLGCYTLMTDEVLDRICDAAHFNLITSVENLTKETRWHFSTDHGQKVIEIISAAHPVIDAQPPVQTTTPVTTIPGPKPRDMVCTGCGQRGHSSECQVLVLSTINNRLKPITRACDTMSKLRILHCRTSQEWETSTIP